ncbi:carboxypeptidase-like regulatory domain-containing protein [Algoriphagus namhaensis]
MLKKIVSLSSFVFLLTLFACEEQQFDIDRFGTITGVVVDGTTYEPLSGVLVTTAPASSALLTDEGGTFTLDKVKEGDVVLSARKKDYLTATVSIAVFEGENTPVTFFLLEDENNVGSITLFDPVPGNGAVDQSTDVTLQWNVEQDNRDIILNYSVFIFESNSTTQQLVGENLTVREAIASGLKANTTYFWYVVAKYEGRNVANSPTWSFRTGS